MARIRGIFTRPCRCNRADEHGEGNVVAKRPLGSTGMQITRVGFGAWAIGGGEWSFGWGSQEDSDSIAAIRHAVEAGVNWVDTAAAYGLGRSEEVVATALEPFSEADRPYVFTKCGLRWDDRDPMAPLRRVEPNALILPRPSPRRFTSSKYALSFGFEPGQPPSMYATPNAASASVNASLSARLKSTPSSSPPD